MTSKEMLEVLLEVLLEAPMVAVARPLLALEMLEGMSVLTLTVVACWMACSRACSAAKYFKYSSNFVYV